MTASTPYISLVVSKPGARPAIISHVPGFKAYYVVYAPDDTVTAVSIFDDYTSAQESNKRALAWIEAELAPFLAGRQQWPGP